MALVDQHNAILTKDNLAKKNWSDDMHCLFCNEVETIDHLFFVRVSSKYTWSLVASVLGASHRPISFGQFWQWASVLLPNRKHFHIIGLAAICWALWTTRNDSCFEKKAIRSPTKIVCSASSFIKYWAGPQTGRNKEELEAGAAALLKTALHFHTQASGNGAGIALLQ